MGKRGKKKKGGGGNGDGAQQQHDPKASWRKTLADSLSILSWDGAVDSDLVTVCVQLSPIVSMMEKLGGIDPMEIVSQLAKTCAHPRLEVRSAAWKAVTECGVESPAVAEASVEAGLHKLALSQLGDVLSGSAPSEPAAEEDPSDTKASDARLASKQAGLRTQLLVCFRLLCETSEVALEGVGTTELQAFCDCVTSACCECRASSAALDLLLVLTDGSGPAALLLAPLWLPIARGRLVGETAPAAATAALVAVITLNVLAALDEAGTSEGGLDALVDAALRVLGEAAMGEATPTMRNLALEHLSNVFVREEEEEEEEKGEPPARTGPHSGEELRRRAASLLPAPKLLLSARGLLHALAADLKRGRKRPRGEQQSAGDMDGGLPGAPPEVDTETASRCMQCAGTILAGCSEAEVAEMATDAWKALSGAAAMLAELGGETQEALLNLLSCLAMRTATPGVGGVPASLLWSLGLDAIRWARAVKGSEAAPHGVALLGQMLALLAAHQETAASSELAEQLHAELRAALLTKNALAAAEAFAALSEAGSLDEAGRAQLPQLREKLTARLESGDDERAAHALELLDAAVMDGAEEK